MSGPFVGRPHSASCAGWGLQHPGVRPQHWRCRKRLRTTGAAAGGGRLCRDAGQARACGLQAGLGGVTRSVECGAVRRALNLVLLPGRGHSSSVPIEPLCFILKNLSSRRTRHLLPPEVHMHAPCRHPSPGFIEGLFRAGCRLGSGSTSER